MRGVRPPDGGTSCVHCQAALSASARRAAQCPQCGKPWSAAAGGPGSSRWYYARNGRAFGPHTSAQLKELAATGQLLPTDLVQRVGSTTWVEATKVKHLFAEPAAHGNAPPVAKRGAPASIASKPAPPPTEKPEPTAPGVADTVRSLEPLVSRHRALSEAVVVPDAGRCVQCGCCTFNCPIGIDVRAHAWRGLPIEDSHCLTCSECVRRCPRGVLNFEVLPVFKK